MTEQEIKDNAPNGSTHYDLSGNYYIVRVKTVAWKWNDNWKPVMFQINEDIKPL